MIDAQDEAAVVSAVRQAKANNRTVDVIDGVKTAIADELKRLDPTLKIKKTGYFNHSYIPDLLATWREGGKEQERRVFIRGSLTSVVASEDVEYLSDQNPLLIGVGEDKRKTLGELRKQLPSTTRTLATEVSATSRIPTYARDDDAQLSSLVRVNIVRDGRGLLSNRTADKIVAVALQDEPLEALKAFQQTVRSLFVGATAERLNRTAGLLTEFFEERPNAETIAQIRDEPLSDGELRVVLPFVLQRAADVKSTLVWEALASMLSLTRLESMSASLAELDLTPVIRPVAGDLIAGKSGLTYNAEVADDEAAAVAPAWRVRNGRLVGDIGRRSIWMGSDAKKVRQRDDGAEARWDELSGPLRTFDLLGIDLQGLSRQVSVANDDADTVRTDVEAIRTTLDDDFHVSSVTVRDKGDEEAGAVKVEFEKVTATGKAAVNFHVRASRLLAAKHPFSDEDIEALTGA